MVLMWEDYIRIYLNTQTEKLLSGNSNCLYHLVTKIKNFNSRYKSFAVLFQPGIAGKSPVKIA